MAKVVGTALQVAGAFTGNPYLYWAGVAINVTDSVEQSRRERRRQRALFNSAQKDRLEMVERDPNQARALVMGRVRYVQGVQRGWQTGVNSEVLTLPVIFAGHEIDAFEKFYLFDTEVTLDGSGWVQQAPWSASQDKQYSIDGTMDGSGNATITLPSAPLTSPAPTAVWSTGSGENLIQGSASVSVVGTTATVTGGQPSATVTVNYWLTDVTKRVRIRAYLGTAAQNIGSALAAEYPGKLRTTDKYAGIPLAVMDCVYDQDVFPQGRPTLTALMRGAKLYDPRKDSTVPGGSGAHRWSNPATWEWSENPALQVLRYFTWEGGWGRPIDEISLADVIEAANACDVSTVFTLRKTDGSTYTETLPRYTCGIAISSAPEVDRRDAMQSIMETMNGRGCWVGGTYRFRAGVKRTAAFTLGEDWLAETVDDTGNTSGEPPISGANGVARDRRFNRISGRCVDPAQRYQMLAFPRVEDPVLVAAKGPRPDDVDFEGVNRIAHAQHLASMMIRKAQAGLRMEAQCGLRALLVEPLDVGAFNLPDYGFAGNEAEVVGWRYSPNGVIRLTFEETSAALYTVDAELRGRDPAPDSSLRKPWDVEQLTGLAVTSGTVPTQDGSILTRTTLAWNAATGASIRNGGEVEIQYTEAGAVLPAGDWPNWTELGNSTGTVIPALPAGRFLWFRGRFVQKIPLVRGKWSTAVRHQVAPPPDTGLNALDVGVPSFTLAADSDGTVGSYASATTTVRVLRAGDDVTSLWTLSRTNGPSITSTFSAGVLSVTGLTADSSYIDVSASLSGYATLTQRIPVAKARGGISVRTATAYIQASSAPSTPTGGSFDFGTGVLTAPSGWSVNRPASSALNTYSADFTFVGSSPTAVVSGGTWSAPVLIAAGVPVDYVINPGTYALNTTATATPTTCVAGIRLLSTGGIGAKASGTSTTYNAAGSWFNGTVGATYYVRFVQRTLTAGTLSGTGASWLALTSNRTVNLTATAGVVADAIVDYQIAADAAGATILAAGTIELHAEST